MIKNVDFFPAIVLWFLFHFDGIGCQQIFKDFLSFLFFQIPKLPAEHSLPTTADCPSAVNRVRFD